jgi:aspartate dehydrogenase
VVRSSDIVIECAPPALLDSIASPVLRAGKRLIVLRVGALLENWHLFELADRHAGQLIVPTGALLGLDAVAAASEGTITSATLVTRKPVAGLLGAPYLVEHGFRLEGITEPVRVFSGSAREAARGFPTNVNVAVALALAGIGPDRTQVEIWADPTIGRNVHSIAVDSDAASFEMRIENVPSENPKTSRITPFSVIAILRKLSGSRWIGS